MGKDLVDSIGDKKEVSSEATKESFEGGMNPNNLNPNIYSRSVTVQYSYMEVDYNDYNKWL